MKQNKEMITYQMVIKIPFKQPIPNKLSFRSWTT